MKFHFIYQYDSSDCGAACLAMICKFYGLKISVTQMREIIGTDKNGTSGFGMVEGCKKLNLDVNAVRIVNNFFKDNIQLPCIAQIQTKYGDHYVVVYKKKGNKLIVADPRLGKIKQKQEDFAKKWTGVLFLIKPNGNFKPQNCFKVSEAIINFLKESHTQKTAKNNKKINWQALDIKRYLFYLMFLSLIGILLGIASSFYYQILIDNVLPSKSYTLLKNITLLFIFVGSFELIISAIRLYLFSVFGKKIDVKIMLKYYNHVLKLPINFFKTRELGEILTNFSSTYHIKDAITQLLVDGCINIILIIGCSITLCTISFKLYLVNFSALLIYCIIIFLFQSRLKKLLKDQIEHNADLDTILIETISEITTIKAFAVDQHFIKKFKKAFLKYLEKSDSLDKTSILEGTLANFVSTIGEILVLCFGVYAIMANKFSIGTFLTFNSLLMFFWNAAQELIELQTTVQITWVNICRIFEVLSLPTEAEERSSQKSPVNLITPIELINVNFRYGSRRSILNNLNMYIEAGAKIAIVGENGMGKSTIAKLLLNFYKPQTGKILFGNNLIDELNLNYLRSKIAYLTQDAVLFKGTLEENLKQKNPRIVEQEFIEICKDCGIDKLVNLLPGGYQFKINDYGANFSGGQKQLIAFTRAIINNPDIIILDEATSNMDSATERRVIELLFNKFKQSTLIIISHKLSLASRCEKIFVLKDGGIIAHGSDIELKENCQFYNKLWQDYYG